MKRFPIIFTIATFLFIAGLIYSIAQPRESEWTITTLKEYFERRLYDVQLAVDEAKEFSKEKFANTNEWRATLENLGRTYMPRMEQESKDKAQDERISAIESDIKKIENLKQGGSIVWAYVIGAFGMIFGLISLMLNFQKKGIK